jgi:hypothetical protein
MTRSMVTPATTRLHLQELLRIQAVIQHKAWDEHSHCFAFTQCLAHCLEPIPAKDHLLVPCDCEMTYTLVRDG